MQDTQTLLTKEALLKGKDKTEEIDIPLLGGKVLLKPLTDGQYTQVEAIRTSGISMKGSPKFTAKGDVDYDAVGNGMNMEIDLKKSEEAEFDADATAVAYSLSVNETWTVDEVKRLKPVGVVKEIAGKVYEVSGVSRKEAAKIANFRNK